MNKEKAYELLIARVYLLEIPLEDEPCDITKLKKAAVDLVGYADGLEDMLRNEQRNNQ